VPDSFHKTKSPNEACRTPPAILQHPRGAGTMGKNRCLRNERPWNPYEFLGLGAMDVAKPFIYIYIYMYINVNVYVCIYIYIFI
jgi:hypothetical protein